MTTEDLKLGKEKLVDALFQLTRAAQDASVAVLNFYEAVATDSSADAATLAKLTSEVADIKPPQETVVVNETVTPSKTEVAVEAVEGKRKQKRVKKERDPNEPKRPLPAYLIYGNQQKREIRKERAEKSEAPLSVSELNAEVLKRWEDLDPAVRTRIDEEHEESVQDYHRRKRAYDETKKAAEGSTETNSAPAPLLEIEDEPKSEASASDKSDKAEKASDKPSDKTDKSDKSSDKAEKKRKKSTSSPEKKRKKKGIESTQF